MPEQHPIKAMLIAGHPRSGTSMLTRVCNTHPDLAITSELKCFLKLEVPPEKHLTGIRKQGKSWLQMLSRVSMAPKTIKKSARIWLTSLWFLLRYQNHIKNADSALITEDVVNDVLHKLSPRAKVIGDKFPGYVFRLNKLTQLENCVPVVIYRDCRDVTRSCFSRSASKWKGTRFGNRLGTVEGVATNWVRAIEAMEQHSDKILAIRYESLVTNPQPELARIGNHLGVDPDGFDAGQIHATSVGRHAGELDETDLDTLNRIAGDAMRRLGYEI